VNSDVVDHVESATDSLRDAGKACEDPEIEEILQDQVRAFNRMLDGLRAMPDKTTDDDESDPDPEDVLEEDDHV
jgi:hypothetical protein